VNYGGLGNRGYLNNGASLPYTSMPGMLDGAVGQCLLPYPPTDNQTGYENFEIHGCSFCESEFARQTA